jgi:16S rRNA (cytidine1402-2'-O)-methyltransferase
LLSALVTAGLPTDAFAFHGFLPSKAGARANAILALRDSRETLVFYESPRRLDDTLAAMAEIFGDRAAAVALELTKRFERVHRGSLSELAASFAGTETKGEAVIVVAGAAAPTAPDAADWQETLLKAMADQPLRAAVDAVSAQYGLKRKEVYDAALALKAQEEQAQ